MSLQLVYDVKSTPTRRRLKEDVNKAIAQGQLSSIANIKNDVPIAWKFTLSSIRGPDRSNLQLKTLANTSKENNDSERFVRDRLLEHRN